jgi:hypothetical protein
MNPGQNHLSDEQIAAAMIEHDAATGAHLRQCRECAAKAESLQATLKDFGSFVHANAERANTFWWRQRAAAASPHRAVPATRWAAAVAAVTIAIGASLTLVHKAGDPGKPYQGAQITPPQQKTISDEALLSEVQNDVQREYADAFAPVQTNAESAVAQQGTVVKSKKAQKNK